ncbi:hypothetical protein BJX63DRAFT_50339 [Aspergillus granulosus]|uniref:Uncharacterized protein n=1 Tax=Aspergillus granulosus TaxID=176169 RepID=A0ABR4GY80_9EURO
MIIIGLDSVDQLSPPFFRVDQSRCQFVKKAKGNGERRCGVGGRHAQEISIAFGDLTESTAATRSSPLDHTCPLTPVPDRRLWELCAASTLPSVAPSNRQTTLHPPISSLIYALVFRIPSIILFHFLSCSVSFPPLPRIRPFAYLQIAYLCHFSPLRSSFPDSESPEPLRLAGASSQKTHQLTTTCAIDAGVIPVSQALSSSSSSRLKDIASRYIFLGG